MKDLFRSTLFEKIRSECTGVSGKQVKVAESIGVKQFDVSLIKRGQIDRFSTDKLIDIAKKCGWSFSFEMVQGDRTAIASAVSKGEADFAAHMNAVFGGGED